MKIIKTIAAAGLLLSTVTIAASAQAQDYRNGNDRGYDHRDRNRGDDRYDRHDNGRHYGGDRGRHYGWDRHHRRCWTEWRHHRRVTVCN